MRLHSLFALVLLGAGSTVFSKENTLTERDIHDRLIGKRITDGTHWSYVLKDDGKIDAIDMGKVRTGTWQISHGELCIRVPAKADADCWTVRQNKAQLFLIKPGLDIEISVEPLGVNE